VNVRQTGGSPPGGAGEPSGDFQNDVTQTLSGGQFGRAGRLADLGEDAAEAAV
jgi:hypothetical protein